MELREDVVGARCARHAVLHELTGVNLTGGSATVSREQSPLSFLPVPPLPDCMIPRQPRYPCSGCRRLSRIPAQEPPAKLSASSSRRALSSEISVGQPRIDEPLRGGGLRDRGCAGVPRS